MNSIGLKIVGCVLAIIATSWVATKALALMNEPSDASVLIGIVILLVLFLVWFLVVGKKISKAIKNAKKIAQGANGMFSICLIFIISAVISFTGCTTVGPGNVGIKINQTGDNRGVDQLPLETGWVTYNIFTQKVFEYPIFVQTVIWTADTKEGAPADESITFNSKEGMVINGDISLSYQLTAEKVPAFYVKFRSDDLKAFTYGFLHNVARDAFNEIGPTFSVEEIYGPSKEFLLKKVVERINSQTKQYGVEIVQFGFTGALRLPPSVIDALNGKIAATQTAMRVHNEVMTAQAEAEKTIATAKGQAEANRILAQSISPQLIQWRNLAITEQWINKWNGQKAQVELGGDNKPLIQIPVPGK